MVDNNLPNVCWLTPVLGTCCWPVQDSLPRRLLNPANTNLWNSLAHQTPAYRQRPYINRARYANIAIRSVARRDSSTCETPHRSCHKHIQKSLPRACCKRLHKFVWNPVYIKIAVNASHPNIFQILGKHPVQNRLTNRVPISVTTAPLLNLDMRIRLKGCHYSRTEPI